MNPEIYYLYLMNHDVDDGMHRSLSGKFFVDEQGNFHVLEDHDGFLKEIEGLDEDKMAKKLQSLEDGMYTEIVPMSHVMHGLRNDLIPTITQQEEAVQTPPRVYSYFRTGMEHAQELKFEDGKATLDGYELSNEELLRLMDNVKQKRATLDVPSNFDNIQKSELEDMFKAANSPELYQALGQMRNAVKTGGLHPDALKVITGHVFKDSMVPAVGNRKAYEDFLSRPRPGVHIHLDANDFGSINKQHGFKAGDEAIKAYGTAIRNAVDESVGRKNAKVFRVGGDEVMLHVPSHEHAAKFVRNLKSHFDKIPAVGGTHKISASIGVGESPETAEHGLIQAKTAKKSMGYTLGQAKTHAYSSIPGHEGHLATE